MQLHTYEREHLATLRTLLPECTVLLKSNGDFPLQGKGKIALYGSGAKNTVKGGTGSGEVNSRYFVSIEQGLRDAGFIITSYNWINAYDKVRAEAKKRFVREIKERAKQHHTMAVLEGMGAVMPEPEYELTLDGEGDTAIYVLSRISGEGNDRDFVSGDILLSETEIRDILALNQKYRRFLLVLNVGGPVDLSPVMEVENILLLSQLGVETGSALADLLLGKTYPSGKLTTTWAKAADYPTIGDFGDRNDTRYKEGIYVGYRYFDSVNIAPQFPFGYGLGYTDFALNGTAPVQDGDCVKLCVKVENTGKRPGKETAQLYVSKPQGKLDQPYQSLAAFAKTKELQPGEQETMELKIAIKDLASFDEESSAWILEAGEYILRLGNSSRDTSVCAVLTVPETLCLRKVRKTLGTPDFQDWRPEKPCAEAAPADAVRLTLDTSVLQEQIVSYDPDEPVDPIVSQLSDEELAYMNVGAFDPKGGVLSIIGNASSTVAGAAGETTGLYQNRGIPVLVMADGPAGLRLSKEFYREKGKTMALGATMPETIAEYLPGIAKSFMKLLEKKPARGTEIQHQYCTAIPIGTAIAQSWNTELARICGDIVGDEMKRFGVHLWLAPALNIHRSIRCGRNFEYFSEDPLISGLFAAAITEGVQAHPGCGTTIKHYAANNQETNRYNSNSQVSPRALREIYLKGFEICVALSQPDALMTSYNLLNGTHTSERRDLTEDILRCEFGYRGIVMTDWVIAAASNKASIHPSARADRVAAAGGDLFMPGSKKDYEKIRAAMKDGSLSRRQLEINATRVLRMARKLTQTK